MAEVSTEVTAIAIEAISAGKDVIYGESHDVMSSTMSEIARTIEGSPHGSIKAVTLEFPAETLKLFSVENIASVTRDEFISQVHNTTTAAYIQGAIDLEQRGVISLAQREFVADFLQENDAAFLRAGAAGYGDMYDMAQIAHAHDIPVIPADVNLERLTANLLTYSDDPDIQITGHKFNHILNAGLDDSSDLDFLEESGIDIHGEGSLISHRGLMHINGERFSNVLENTNGLDDLLEREGREVLTIGIVSDAYREMLDSVDPTDVNVVFSSEGEMTVEYLNVSIAPEISGAPELSFSDNIPNFQIWRHEQEGGEFGGYSLGEEVSLENNGSISMSSEFTQSAEAFEAPEYMRPDAVKSFTITPQEIAPFTP